MQDASGNVIARKLEVARKISSPIPRMGDVLAKMTKHIEKEARDYLGSVVEAMIIDADAKKFSDVLDGISMPAMIGIIEVNGAQRTALMNLDLDLVYHVVDLRMGGLPSELPDFAARRPTSIDWNMCQPLVDIALEAFQVALEDCFGIEDGVDLTCSTFEHLPMLANIVPERADVYCIQVSLDIGEAARSGNFELVIPLAAFDGIMAQIKKTFNVNASGQADAWAAHMLNVVMDSEVAVLPVLHSSTLSVGELSRLDVGDVLPLDLNAHQRVAVQIEMPGETVTIAQGRLGVLKTNKALKLTESPDGEFLSPLRRVVAKSRV